MKVCPKCGTSVLLIPSRKGIKKYRCKKCGWEAELDYTQARIKI
jgi:predicted RNA-binding Zn-ribbon protein involved in translation (DUF1610 family)